MLRWLLLDVVELVRVKTVIGLVMIMGDLFCGVRLVDSARVKYLEQSLL